MLCTLRCRARELYVDGLHVVWAAPAPVPGGDYCIAQEEHLHLATWGNVLGSKLHYHASVVAVNPCIRGYVFCEQCGSACFEVPAAT